MKRFPLPILAMLGLFGCGDVAPVPAEFDAAFATGTFCIPSQIANASPTTHYPVRFVYHLYDCVNVTPGTQFIRTIYTCPGGGLPCQMVVLATAHLTRDDAVQQASGCDARDLESPPSGRFEEVTQDFSVSLPAFGGTPVSGPFLITIPYLTLEQGQRVIERIDAGDDPYTVISEEVGQQNFPSRQVSVTFSETATPVASAAAILPADCHTIPVP
jgi:hypothetical protein